MASIGPNYGNTVTNSGSLGDNLWTNVPNFLDDDSLYTTTVSQLSFPVIYFDKVKLVINNIVTGSNIIESNRSLTNSDIYHTFGSNSSSFGLNLNTNNINDINFGCAVNMKEIAEGLYKTEYIILTDFNFNIPDNSVIDGVMCEIKGYYTTVRLNITTYMNTARLTVYYTESGGSVQKQCKSIGINKIKGLHHIKF